MVLEIVFLYLGSLECSVLTVYCPYMHWLLSLLSNFISDHGTLKRAVVIYILLPMSDKHYYSPHLQLQIYFTISSINESFLHCLPCLLSLLYLPSSPHLPIFIHTSSCNTYFRFTTTYTYTHTYLLYPSHISNHDPCNIGNPHILNAI